MIFDNKIYGSDFIRQAVITETNKYGDLTEEQFKEITGEDF